MECGIRIRMFNLKNKDSMTKNLIPTTNMLTILSLCCIPNIGLWVLSQGKKMHIPLKLMSILVLHSLGRLHHPPQPSRPVKHSSSWFITTHRCKSILPRHNGHTTTSSVPTRIKTRYQQRTCFPFGNIEHSYVVRISVWSFNSINQNPWSLKCQNPLLKNIFIIV